MKPTLFQPSRSPVSKCHSVHPQGEQPVKQIAKPFPMSLPANSQHLSVLCEAELVTQRREGRQRFYRLNPEPLKQVSDWVNHYEQF